MTIHQFFIEQSRIDENRMVVIRGTDAKHMRTVLRLRKGDRVRLVDEMQRLYLGSVERISRESVLVSLNEAIDCAGERTRVGLVQGIPRLPRADLIAQKLTELGLARITFVPMARSPYKDAFARIQKRLTRLNLIAEAAAKQCGRRSVPQITASEDLAEVVRTQKGAGIMLVASEKTGGEPLQAILSGADPASPVTIFIGPEGGFSDRELSLFQAERVACFSLGRNILRTETAAIVAAAIVLYELGEI